MRRFILAVVACAAAGPACAQGLQFTPFEVTPRSQPYVPIPLLTGPVDTANTYVTVGYNPSKTYDVFTPTPNGLISLADLLSASGAASQAGLSTSLAAIAARIDRFAGWFREGIALAGSINVMPPEPGRYINISVGGAGYDGSGAGSIAVSGRLGRDVIGYVGVARGPTQSLVKGGLSWSPW